MKCKVEEDFFLRGKSYKRGDEIDLTEEQSIRLADYVEPIKIETAEAESMDSPPKDKMIRKAKNKGGIRG